MPWAEIITAVITAGGTLGAVWLTYFLNKRSSKKKKDDISKRIQRDTVLYKILNQIREKFNFSRVFISQFHNGGKYYTGEAIQKASISFETIAPGVQPLSPEMQGVPLSTMATSLRHISDCGTFIVNNVEEVKDEHYKNLMKAYGETAHYSIKIEDPTGWIGVLVCDYTGPHEDITPSCVEWLCVQATRLSSLLSLTNKKYTTDSNV